MNEAAFGGPDDHVTARYDKGVLIVHVPKTAEGTPHVVEITKPLEPTASQTLHG